MINNSVFNIVDIIINILLIIIGLNSETIFVNTNHLINRFVSVNIPYNYSQAYVGYSINLDTPLQAFISNYYGG
ncbi:hypothetical protein YN1HA_9660 [Sulfurisphaera ohwakuensis]